MTDHRQPERLSTPAYVALMRSPTRAPSPAPPPRDCVRRVPVVGDTSVELIGYDFEGHARIKIVLGADVELADWERWILRWVRGRYGRRSLAVMR